MTSNCNYERFFDSPHPKSAYNHPSGLAAQSRVVNCGVEEPDLSAGVQRASGGRSPLQRSLSRPSGPLCAEPNLPARRVMGFGAKIMAALVGPPKSSSSSELVESLPPRRVFRSSTLHSSTSRRSVTPIQRVEKLVVMPKSVALCYWDLGVFIGVIVTGIWEPLLICFDLSRRYTYWFDICLSMTFMADTVSYFFRAVKESTREGAVVVTEPRDIARRYLRSDFSIDFVSAFPFNLFLGSVAIGRVLRLLRLLRFWRLPRLMDHLQAIFGFSFRTINTLEFMLIIVIVLHWLACAWVFCGRKEQESWLMAVQRKFQSFEVQDNVNTYLLSLYWSVTVLSSVGFGDITPVARLEFVVAILCMALGGGVWAYVVGNVCGMVTALDKHRISYENTMNDVNVICQERRLPKDLQAKVRKFYHHSQEFLRMKQYHDTIGELSPALKGEVMLWMYGECFRKVWYLEGIDTKCAVVLSEGMVPYMFAPDEWIEDSVHGMRCLMFLRSGLCVRKCGLLAPGSVWGTDVILSSDEKRDIEELLDRVNARSVTFAFVLRLPKMSIDHAAGLFPEFAKRLRKSHLRMLLLRGIVATARAVKRQEAGAPPKPETEFSRWEKLGHSMSSRMHREGTAACSRELGRMASTSVAKQVVVANGKTSPTDGKGMPTALQPVPTEEGADYDDYRRSPRSSGASSPESCILEVPRKTQKGPAWGRTLPNSPRSGGCFKKDATAMEGSITTEFSTVASLPAWCAATDRRIDAQDKQLSKVVEELEELTGLTRRLLQRLDAEEKY